MTDRKLHQGNSGAMYFARTGKLVKIGWTGSSIKERLRAFGRVSRDPVRLVACFLCGHNWELEAHRVLRSFSYQGEWYIAEHPAIERVVNAASISGERFWRLLSKMPRGGRILSELDAIITVSTLPVPAELQNGQTAGHVALAGICKRIGRGGKSRLAEFLGLNLAYVSSLTPGNRSPSRKIEYLIEERLGIPLQWWLRPSNGRTRLPAKAKAFVREHTK